MADNNGGRLARANSILGATEETARRVERLTKVLVLITCHIVAMVAMILGALTGSSALHNVAVFFG